MQRDLAYACPCPSHPYSSKPCIYELPEEAPDADDMMCSGFQSPRPAVTQCLSSRLHFRLLGQRWTEFREAHALGSPSLPT